MSGFTHEPPGGGSPDWYTPPHLFDALGIEFDLDPCAPNLPDADWIPAHQRYSLPADGLSLPWEGRIWLNPPYAAETAKWLGKLQTHGDGVALVFARTDTAWGQSALRIADAVCFIEGRLNFVPSAEFIAANGTTSSAGSPSMLLAFGKDCADAVLQADLGVSFSGATARRQLSLAPPE